MTNAFRGRWDAKGNPRSVKSYPVLSTVAIEAGDLCWWDAVYQTARSFSDTAAWTGTLDGSQGKVAETFLGSAQSAHAAGDTLVTEVRIAARGVYGYPLATADTLEVGDLVTAARDGSSNLLLAQAVVKGAIKGIGGGSYYEPTPRARELAIGKAAKRYPTATTGSVDVEFIGTREAGGGPRQYLTS